MPEVAAASLALRASPRPEAVIREPPSGLRFPNGWVPLTEDVIDLNVPVTARRWWDPTVVVGGVCLDLAARFVRSIDPIRLPAAPEDCVGWGPGSTPAGDDVVVGMLIGYRIAGDRRRADALAEACRPGETTPLSRTLLDHAAAGETMAPVQRLASALCGSGSVDRAVDRLRNVGATSGAHMIDGIRRALMEAA